MVITSSGRKAGQYASTKTAEFEKATFSMVATLSTQVPYNDAFVYALVQHGAEAVAKSGVLNKPRAVTAAFTSYSDAVSKSNVRANYEATPKTAAIGDVQKGIKIPGDNKDVFEALYTIAAHTNTRCEFEAYPERVAGFGTAVNRVGLAAALAEVKDHYPLNHQDTIARALNTAIFEAGRQAGTHTL